MQLNLTSRSGRAAVKHRMEEMGYRERLQPDHLYDAFLKLADKKAVFDYDLEALAFINKQQEEPEHFRGLLQRPIRIQRYRHRLDQTGLRDEIKTEAANGNGPVDAIYRRLIASPTTTLN